MEGEEKKREKRKKPIFQEKRENGGSRGTLAGDVEGGGRGGEVPLNNLNPNRKEVGKKKERTEVSSSSSRYSPTFLTTLYSVEGIGRGERRRRK